MNDEQQREIERLRGLANELTDALGNCRHPDAETVKGSDCPVCQLMARSYAALDVFHRTTVVLATDYDAKCAEVERLTQRCTEHEQFRHQHRDCDSMGIELQKLRGLLREARDELDGDFGSEVSIAIVHRIDAALAGELK